MDIALQQLDESHITSCAQLYCRTYQEEPWNESWPSPQPIVEFIQAHLGNNYFRGYIAKYGDEVIAVSIGFKKPWPGGVEYYIDEFFIDPDYQRKGIGTQLMAFIEARCRDEGLNAIILNTQKGYASDDFYTRNGFKEHRGLIVLSKSLANHQEAALALYTSRLLLRPVAKDDLGDLFAIYGDPATNTFNPAGPYPDIAYTKTVLDRWLAHWAEHGFGSWAIALRDAPEKIIGFGGLSLRSFADIPMNNLGYRFATSAWGKGLASELSQFAVRYGFEALNMGEICGVVRANHLASRKVLEKAGLQFVREIADIENAPPSLLYALSRDEWQKSAPHPSA